MAAERRPVFLSPHFDDVALSCGGTVAALAEEGGRPLIVTVFAGQPAKALDEFARFQHQRWGLDTEDSIAARRAEDRCAADALGAEVRWLSFRDAIYREGRYDTEERLFGEVHPDEGALPGAVTAAVRSLLRDLSATPAAVYVPLGVGNHVDHQIVRGAGEHLLARGVAVLAYEDYPYGGDPGREHELLERVSRYTDGGALLRPLTATQLDKRIRAIKCYPSQLPTIFRFQGEPAEATRAWARRQGNGQPAERFWPLRV